jgi:hypothetical protein
MSRARIRQQLHSNVEEAVSTLFRFYKRVAGEKRDNETLQELDSEYNQIVSQLEDLEMRMSMQLSLDESSNINEFRELLNKINVLAEDVVPVPNFETSEQARRFVLNLNGSDSVSDHVIDPETGEVLLEPGIKKAKAFKVKDDTERSRAYDHDDFEDLYHVVTASIAKITGHDESQSQMIGADLSAHIPYLVSRKDLLPLDEEDLDEINEYLEDRYFEQYFGVRVSASISNNSKRAIINVEFQ